MARHIAIYGFIAGLIVGGTMIGFMLKGPDSLPSSEEGLLYGYLTMLVALTAVFLGIKHYRDKVLGGAIRFMPASRSAAPGGRRSILARRSRRPPLPGL